MVKLFTWITLDKGRLLFAKTGIGELVFFSFLKPFFVSSHMYPENPEGTRVILGSMNMWYIRHCQESNSQPVLSQVRADSTRPQYRTILELEFPKILQTTWIQ